MQTEAYFSDAIRPALLREIGLAQQSIYVAVAWFTDPALFAALLARQRVGVAVALAVADDAINFEPGRLPFEGLTATGGQFFRVSGALMHHKFCVLDGRDLITGSYNWTNRAALENRENIILMKGAHELARCFIAEFRTITGQKLAVGVSAVRSDSQDVQVWDDPRIPALRLEIQLRELELVALDNERVEAERIVAAFRERFTEILGSLLEEILRLKAKVADRLRQANPTSTFAESEYQQAQRRYEEQCRQRADTEAAASRTFDLDADARAELKRMYREAALLCHTDRVAEPQKAAATAAFQALQEAYRRQDVAAVQAQLYDLQRGRFTPDSVMLVDVTALTTKRDHLHDKQLDLLALLEVIRKSQPYSLGRDEAATTTYLATTKTQLEAELARLQRLYEQPA